MHIPYKEALGLTGTIMFASVHSHLGVELGRRDDLESLAYILIYFLCGSLPWQGLGQGRDLVAKSKQETSTSALCYGLPAKFQAFLEYSCSLSFNDKPDYGYLSHLFGNLLLPEGSQNDVFNWDTVNSQIDRQ
jgi:hypothetical protein